VGAVGYRRPVRRPLRSPRHLEGPGRRRTWQVSRQSGMGTTTSRPSLRPCNKNISPAGVAAQLNPPMGIIRPCPGHSHQDPHPCILAPDPLLHLQLYPLTTLPCSPLEADDRLRPHPCLNRSTTIGSGTISSVSSRLAIGPLSDPTAPERVSERPTPTLIRLVELDLTVQDLNSTSTR
jgi:hypothetical protein